MLTFMLSTYSAKEPALGYYYQIIRGLVQLLYENRMANPCLSFECLDDIAIEEAGNEDSGEVELYQAKLHITPAQMTDRSTDFWKTIRIWSEGIQDGTFNPAVTIFTLITTASIPEDSFLKLFFRNKEEDKKSILTMMETIATETTNKSNKPGYEAFSKLTEYQKQGLINNIRINDSNVSIDNTMAQLRYRLELSASTSALDSLIDSVVGWWFRNAVDMLQAESKQTISKSTVNNYIQACRDQIRADILPDEFFEKVEIDDIALEESKDKTFVRQLTLIDATKREKKAAISDYKRAYGQRSKWLRDGRVSQLEYDTFDADLQEGWNSRFEMMLDDTEGKGEDERKKAGHFFYRKNYVDPQYQLTLFRNKASLYITKGSYQILSNNKTIGWHPDFKELLNDDKTVE